MEETNDIWFNCLWFFDLVLRLKFLFGLWHDVISVICVCNFILYQNIVLGLRDSSLIDVIPEPRRNIDGVSVIMFRGTMFWFLIPQLMVGLEHGYLVFPSSSEVLSCLWSFLMLESFYRLVIVLYGWRRGIYVLFFWLSSLLLFFEKALNAFRKFSMMQLT